MRFRRNREIDEEFVLELFELKRFFFFPTFSTTWLHNLVRYNGTYSIPRDQVVAFTSNPKEGQFDYLNLTISFKRKQKR
jgi:hypothetical protein